MLIVAVLALLALCGCGHSKEEDFLTPKRYGPLNVLPSYKCDACEVSHCAETGF
jgi:hypothetical protein